MIKKIAAAAILVWLGLSIQHWGPLVARLF